MLTIFIAVKKKIAKYLSLKINDLIELYTNNNSAHREEKTMRKQTTETETKQTCSKTRLPPPNEKQQLKQHVLLTQQNADTFRSALNNNHNADNTISAQIYNYGKCNFFAASLNILNSNLMIWLNFNNNDKIIKNVVDVLAFFGISLSVPLQCVSEHSARYRYCRLIVLAFNIFMAPVCPTRHYTDRVPKSRNI